MKVFDFLIDEDNDLLIADGRIVTGESTPQHEKLLLVTEPGQMKLFATTGVGLNGYLLDDLTDEDMKSNIRSQYEGDGLAVGKLSLSNGNLSTKVEYKNNGA